MAEVPPHALITGPIVGRVPIDHPEHPDGWVNVTPDVLYPVDDEHLAALLQAIEDEHYARGSHPALETGGS